MIKIKLWRPKKCNCVFWAVGMQFLTGWKGRIVITKSNLWPGFCPILSLVGFHAIWVSPDGQILSYSPNKEDRVNKKQIKKEILFEGYVKKHPKSDIGKDDND